MHELKQIFQDHTTAAYNIADTVHDLTEIDRKRSMQIALAIIARLANNKPPLLIERYESANGDKPKQPPSKTMSTPDNQQVKPDYLRNLCEMGVVRKIRSNQGVKFTWDGTYLVDSQGVRVFLSSPFLSPIWFNDEPTLFEVCKSKGFDLIGKCDGIQLSIGTPTLRCADTFPADLLRELLDVVNDYNNDDGDGNHSW